MYTEIIRLNGGAEDEAAISKAGGLIKAGELVGMPTETVYGLAGDALNPASSKKIYAAKGRPSDNPLIVHISDWDHLKPIVSEIPESAKLLADKFWPGPLTLIFNKSDLIPLETTGGLETVAVRMPIHPVARALIRESTGYIAAPSANASGRPSCTTAEEVYEDMNGLIPLILDGGPSDIGLESTILDLSDSVPELLRPGGISLSELTACLGNIKINPAIDGVLDPAQKPKAPGMKYRHYAPKGRLIIVEGARDKVVAAINHELMKALSTGKKAAVIASEETADEYKGDIVRSIGSLTDESEIARRLFNILREMDKLNAELIFAEAFHTPRLGMAIMNRLIRAAGHNIIYV